MGQNLALGAVLTRRHEVHSDVSKWDQTRRSVDRLGRTVQTEDRRGHGEKGRSIADRWKQGLFLLFDFILAVLVVAISHGNIRIEGRFLEILVFSDSQGGLVHQFNRSDNN